MKQDSKIKDSKELSTSTSFESKNINYGWVCPKCGRVYSPWVYECMHCQPKVTTGSSTQVDLSKNANITSNPPIVYTIA